MSRVLGAERPASSPELNPGETPERAGAPPLVAPAPLSVLALEQGAGLVPRREGREGVHKGQRRLPHELLATDSAREVARPRGEILRCLDFAGEPPEDVLHRASAPAQHVVVELLGKLEGCACMIGRRLETCRPRESAVDLGL